MQLEPGDPVEEARITMVVEFSCVVTGTLAGLGKAKEEFELLAKGFSRGCREADVQVVAPQGTVRPMTREEAVAFTPRKFHWAPDDERACETPHVSTRQLTKDETKVTCRLCLKKLKEEHERLEAGRSQAKGREERQDT